MSGIRKLDTGDRDSLFTGQVILDTAAVVKELLENALDAGATRVDIRVRGPAGLKSVVVTDNGSGIASEDLDSVCRMHTTSKLSRFEDMDAVATLGFRGEALAAIVALSERVLLLTKTEGETVGSAVEYAPPGEAVKRQPAPRTVGTTITVENFFARLPVRRKEAEQNAKKEIGKAIAIIQAYALIKFSVKISLTVDSNSILQTSGTGNCQLPDEVNLLNNALLLFGTKQASFLRKVRSNELVKWFREDDATENNWDGDPTREEENASQETWSVCGVISKAERDAGRSSSDRQFIFVNGRPVDFPRLTRACNEAYRKFCSANHPVLILSFNSEDARIDANLQPDKRKVTFRSERALVDATAELLADTWEEGQTQIRMAPSPKQTLLISQMSTNPRSDLNVGSSPLPQPRKSTDRPAGARSGTDGSSTSRPSNQEAVIEAGDRGRIILNDAVNAAVLRARDAQSATTVSSTCTSESRARASAATEEGPDRSKDNVRTETEQEQSPRVRPPAAHWLPPERSERRKRHILQADKKNSSLANFVLRKRQRVTGPSTVVNTEAAAEKEPEAHRRASTTPRTLPLKDSATLPAANLATDPAEQLPQFDEPRAEDDNHPEYGTLWFGGKEIMKRLQSQSRDTNSQGQAENTPVFDKSSLNSGQTNESEAESELRLKFQKAWFADLRIIGQFNLGFILCELRGDIFIIDQHAADEKFNFEDLSKNSELQIQPLMKPIQLHLSWDEEALVEDHMDVFRRAGFEISSDSSAGSTRRMKLHSVPTSKHFVFGEEDVRQMIDDLRRRIDCGQKPPEVLRPRKIRDIFASRACRKSIMIGDALSLGKMRHVVSALATLDSPWNCPHGRPTLRHLWNLKKV
mmetsp:Transcript_806/g.2602  ORF Transcript_806/g.2602 Transcript_806/m.2602 type:complete len:867 (-) Transcript_806:3425-6025(-)